MTNHVMTDSGEIIISFIKNRFVNSDSLNNQQKKQKVTCYRIKLRENSNKR